MTTHNFSFSWACVMALTFYEWVVTLFPPWTWNSELYFFRLSSLVKRRLFVSKAFLDDARRKKESQPDLRSEQNIFSASTELSTAGRRQRGE